MAENTQHTHAHKEKKKSVSEVSAIALTDYQKSTLPQCTLKRRKKKSMHEPLSSQGREK